MPSATARPAPINDPSSSTKHLYRLFENTNRNSLGFLSPSGAIR